MAERVEDLKLLKGKTIKSAKVKDCDINIGFTDGSNVVIGFNIYEEFQVKLNRPADKNHTKED